MKTERPFSQELWDQTLAAVQDYLRALENRVAALEGIVQRWEATVPHVTERLQQDSRTSSRPHRAVHPRSSAGGHDIEAMIDCGGRSRELGEALRAQAGQMFRWGHRVRAGTLSHASVASDMRPVRREVERLLEAGRTCGRLNTEGSCREILTLRPALWTFVRHAGVEPTNHAAERAIRPGVLWRKSSFGTHRSEGSQCAEAMMTVVATLK